MERVECPLCHAPHELLTAKNGHRFVVCIPWGGQKVFFNEGPPEEWLKKTMAPKPKGRDLL